MFLKILFLKIMLFLFVSHKQLQWIPIKHLLDYGDFFD